MTAGGLLPPSSFSSSPASEVPEAQLVAQTSNAVPGAVPGLYLVVNFADLVHEGFADKAPRSDADMLFGSRFAGGPNATVSAPTRPGKQSDGLRLLGEVL